MIRGYPGVAATDNFTSDSCAMSSNHLFFSAARYISFLRTFCANLLGTTQEGLRGETKVALEVIVQMTLTREANLVGNFGDALMTRAQELLGPFYATADMVLMRCATQGLLEKTRKVEFAQMRYVRQLRKTYLLIETCVNISDDAINLFFRQPLTAASQNGTANHVSR